jgi:signal recognition particle subunit SRP68
MDITNFILSHRERALLIGDYGTYRSQLSRQLVTLRKRLGRSTPKKAKFTAKPITVEDFKSNNEYD